MLLINKFVELVQEDKLIREWPECAKELENLVRTLPERDLVFPLLACEAAAGESEKAIPVSLAWNALHCGVVLLDKVIDRDELEGFHSYEQMAALSSGPIFAAHHILSMLGDPTVSQRAGNILFQGFFNCAYGQYLDLTQGRQEMQTEQALNAYWRMTLLKSGSVYQAGLAAGAASATEAKGLIEALGNYGRAFGVIKQLMDDCSDILDADGTLEWTLPVLLYNTAKKSSPLIPMERETLFRLLDGAHIPETLAAVVTEWQHRALESLKPLPSSEAKQKLENYVTELVFPSEFLSSLGINHKTLL